ncbi:unnamed protein product [Prunus armeniaca]|uniref:Uncharacterized protein n=1 Tax=Prunus armeniaca TaxID=36596 RepID=A0A6J5WEU2_PRUAR|nr:unnamed protein product [Prunus armeniaca]
MCALIIPFPSNLVLLRCIVLLLFFNSFQFNLKKTNYYRQFTAPSDVCWPRLQEQKVKINSDTKKEDKNGSCSAAGIALADGPKLGTPPEKLGKHLLQFVLPCPQIRSVADEALSFVVF